MSSNRYWALPYDSLVELLLKSTRELLEALDKGNEGEIKAQKRQVELLNAVLMEKLVEKKAHEKPGSGILRT